MKTDDLVTTQCSPHLPGGWVPANACREIEEELIETRRRYDNACAVADKLMATNRNLTGIVRDALAGFKITQHIEDYPQDDWCNRAERILSNVRDDLHSPEGGSKKTSESVDGAVLAMGEKIS